MTMYSNHVLVGTATMYSICVMWVQRLCIVVVYNGCRNYVQ